MGLDHVIKVIGDYWDEHSSEFDKEHDTEDSKAWETTLSELIGKDTNKSIVDLGTGTGFLANMTARLGYPTVGIDLSREMMKYAVRHGGKCTGTAVYGRYCGLHNKRASALDSDRAQKGPERVVPGNPSGRKGNVF